MTRGAGLPRFRPEIDVAGGARETEAGPLGTTPEQRAGFERRLRQALRIIKGRNAAAALSRCDRCASVELFSRGGANAGGGRQASRSGGYGAAQRVVAASVPAGLQGAKRRACGAERLSTESRHFLSSGLFTRKEGDAPGGAAAAGGDHHCRLHRAIPICSKSRRRSWQKLDFASAEAGAIRAFLLDYAAQDNALEHEPRCRRPGTGGLWRAIANRCIPGWCRACDGFSIRMPMDCVSRTP